jgi:hypothetical protein
MCLVFILSKCKEGNIVELTKASKRYMLTGLSFLFIARAMSRPIDINIDTIRSDGLEN